MIHCSKKAFEETVSDRGYTLAECLPCVVSSQETKDGTVYGVDETHPSYPRWRGEQPLSGPGTHLKAMLARIGIKAGKHCSCSKRAAYMDRMGPQWCEENIELIVGWLADEARKRRLPFLRPVGRMLVRRAIMVSHGR